MLRAARGHEAADLGGLAKAIAEVLGGERVEGGKHEAVGRGRRAHEVEVDARPSLALEGAGEPEQQCRLARARRAAEHERGTRQGGSAESVLEARARDLEQAHRSRSGIFTPRSRATSCARS